MRTLLAIGVVLAVTAAASADFFDNFDSYADQAAFEAAWPGYGTYGSLPLDQTFGYSGNQSVKSDRAASYTERNYRNLGSEHAGTDAAPLVFEFEMYSDDSASSNPSNARDYCEIRGYTGAGLDDGSLEGLIAVGIYNGVSGGGSVYQARVLYGGSNWFNLTADRIYNEWVNMKVVISTGAIEFYVNDVLAGSDTRTDVTYDSLSMGSGLTSAGVVTWFDDVSVYNVPEPGSLALLALGALAVIRRR